MRIDFINYLDWSLRNDDNLLKQYVEEINRSINLDDVNDFKGFVGWVAKQYDPDMDWESCFNFDNQDEIIKDLKNVLLFNR